jgi:hypothetical protein
MKFKGEKVIMKKTILIISILLGIGLGILVGIYLKENKNFPNIHNANTTEGSSSSIINSEHADSVPEASEALATIQEPMTAGISTVKSESSDEKVTKETSAYEKAIELVKKVFIDNPLKIIVDVELKSDAEKFYIFRVFNAADLNKNTLTNIWFDNTNDKVYLTIPPDENGHGTRCGEQINEWNPQEDMSYIYNKHIKGKDFDKMGSNLAVEALSEIFAGHSLNDLDGIKEILGETIKETVKPNDDYERWFFDNGIEVDIASQGVDNNTVSNYLYISSQSKIKTSRNIGIGNSKKDVFNAYKDEINPEKVSDDRIVLGNSTSIVFVMKNDKVDSIYIGTGYFIGMDTNIYFTERD